VVKRPTSLTEKHNVGEFQCPNSEMTEWIKKYALQSDRGGHTKTMVITSDGLRVIGYYAFTINSVEHVETTLPRATKGLAKYPIPIFLIARLAIDSDFQGQRLGTRLLCHALKRAAQLAARDIPLRAVVVDAIDDNARMFYEKFGFQPWPIDSYRMWLLMKDLHKALNLNG
jgi:GNAT superfamily N-acetyltransferase